MKNLLLCSMLLVAFSNQAIAQQTNYDVTPGYGNGLRFWSSNSYKIHMGNSAEYHYGPVTDYSIKMNMNSTAGRGWTWGITGSTPIAALGIDGRMQISNSFTAGKIIGAGFETKKSSYTKFELAQHDWSGSHAILFNAYKSISVSGGLLSKGNTKYANNVGSYSGGAGAIMFLGNGGGMYFLISPGSTGADQDINWGTPKMYINRSGRVGIGTSTPKSYLDVRGDITLNNYSINSEGGSSISFGKSGIGNENDDIGINIEDNGELEIKSDSKNALTIGQGIILLGKDDDFKIGIGVTMPKYKLTVDGIISTTEVKVSTTPNSDFVFEPDYTLKSIEEVESFIKDNKHLPDIPSAEEFKENGVGLGEMDDMLLRKIEELTLYVIRQNAELKAHSERLEMLQEENEKLRDKEEANKKEFEELKTMVKKLMKEK